MNFSSPCHYCLWTCFPVSPKWPILQKVLHLYTMHSHFLELCRILSCFVSWI
uniref:Uncharacterized protein n=1 Tax=Arundo donax TaxID=35708 RepID=A0A0A8Z797_ARUDO